jgi:hypothetical protein
MTIVMLSIVWCAPHDRGGESTPLGAPPLVQTAEFVRSGGRHAA